MSKVFLRSRLEYFSLYGSVRDVLRKTLTAQTADCTNMPMPIKLQIHTFKRIFKAYNKNSDRLDEIDFDILDNLAELSENMQTLRDAYPEFCWSKHDIDLGGMVCDERRIEPEPTDELCFTKYVTIRPHRVRSKGKMYESGRIQISINPKFVGYKARVEVEIFVPKNNEEPIPEELEKELAEISEQDEEYWAQHDAYMYEEEKEQKEI